MKLIVINRIPKLLGPLRIILYVCFIFSWFKDNIPPLRDVAIPSWPFLILLLAVLLIPWILRRKTRRTKIRFGAPKIPAALVGILILTVLIHIPYLVHAFGLNSSDDAIPALMAKHIVEGKVPPISLYGQLYLGTLSSHILALAYLVFGYSVVLLNLMALLFYLAFIVIHFYLVQKVLSAPLALATSFFFSLPIGHLISVSSDNGTPYAMVLFLGTSLVYLSYLVSYEHQERWIPWIGFLMGLSFWTHQNTVYFILTACVLLIYKARLPLKRYALLFFYGALGGLPLIMQEVYEKFQLLRFLKPGKMGMKVLSGEKLGRTAELTASLLSRSGHWLGYLFLVFVVAGFIVLVLGSVKKKTISPAHIFTAYFVIFYLVYLGSDFSNVRVVRYLYPLYFCLPVLLLSVFRVLRRRWAATVPFFFVLILFSFFNLRPNYSLYLASSRLHHDLSRVVASMERTGNTYWLGDYWTAYLLTALTGERIIVNSYNFKRYLPYRLDYYNQNQKENFIFRGKPESQEKRGATLLLRLLDFSGVDYKKETVGDSWLVYDIENPVTPRLFLDPMVMAIPVPARLPQLDLTRIGCSHGYLDLVFSNEQTGESPPFRVHAEIPGYSRASRPFSLADKEVKIRLPFPPVQSLTISYFVDFLGFKIRPTVRATVYSPPQAERDRKSRVAYLSGFGPETRFFDKEMTVCEKDVVLEILQQKARSADVSLALYSPFQFAHPYWYGKYAQEVEISLNRRSLGRIGLKDGENVVTIAAENPLWTRGANRIALSFKYHLPLTFAYTWRTAALLGGVQVGPGRAKKQPSPLRP